MSVDTIGAVMSIGAVDSVHSVDAVAACDSRRTSRACGRLRGKEAGGKLVALVIGELPLDSKLVLAAVARRARDAHLSGRCRNASDQSSVVRILARGRVRPEQREQESKRGEQQAEQGKASVNAPTPAVV
jgi:hypothetical protein